MPDGTAFLNSLGQYEFPLNPITASDNNAFSEKFSGSSEPTDPFRHQFWGRFFSCSINAILATIERNAKILF
jgi:hypothetical protein